MSQQEKVWLYTLSTCSHCKAAKRFLSINGVEYDFIDVDLLQGEEKRAALDSVRRYNPAASFPTIIIGSKIIVGFKEGEIREALGL